MDEQARRAAALAAALRRLDDPERDRRRLARTVKVTNPDATDEDREVEVERLFRAIRGRPATREDADRLAAIRRRLEAIRQQ